MSESVAEQRFAQYVLPEVEVLLRVANSLTRNRADAEDLVQDTMIRAFKAIERFDGRHPRAWLLTILRNTHINRNRRRRPELLRDPDVQLERAARTPEDDEAVRPDRFVDLQFDAEVERALSELPPKFGEVIELVDIDGLSYAEAADVLDIPIGTVMSRLHRGRTRIREHLRRVGAGPGFDNDGHHDQDHHDQDHHDQDHHDQDHHDNDNDHDHHDNDHHDNDNDHDHDHDHSDDHGRPR